MFCNKCGSSLPSEGAVCKFCGAMMDKDQIELRKKMNEKNDNKNAPLLKSDRYGVEKTHIYNIDEKKNNKAIGLVVISVVVLFVILLAILLNVM